MEIKENSNKSSEILNAYNIRNKVILDNLKLGGPNYNVLDFGCGFGISTNILAESIPNINITGFDINQERINVAQTVNWSKPTKNVNFTSSIKEAHKNGPYDNIISSFVLEESGTEILHDFNNLLAPKGILILFFYDIKGKNIDQFSFDTGAEKDTIKKMGLEEAKQRWSKMDTLNYIKNVQDVGLTVFKTDKLPQNEGKYAYLIAQKK